MPTPVIIPHWLKNLDTAITAIDAAIGQSLNEEHEVEADLERLRQTPPVLEWPEGVRLVLEAETEAPAVAAPQPVKSARAAKKKDETPPAAIPAPLVAAPALMAAAAPEAPPVAPAAPIVAAAPVSEEPPTPPAEVAPIVAAAPVSEEPPAPPAEVAPIVAALGASEATLEAPSAPPAPPTEVAAPVTAVMQALDETAPASQEHPTPPADAAFHTAILGTPGSGMSVGLLNLAPQAPHGDLLKDFPAPLADGAALTVLDDLTPPSDLFAEALADLDIDAPPPGTLEETTDALEETPEAWGDVEGEALVSAGVAPLDAEAPAPAPVMAAAPQSRRPASLREAFKH